MFSETLERVRHYTTKETAHWREPCELGLGFAVTIWFLATGDSYVSLSLLFRVHRSTTGEIIYETSETLAIECMDEVIACPTTTDSCKDVARGFSDGGASSTHPDHSTTSQHILQLHL